MGLPTKSYELYVDYITLSLKKHIFKIYIYFLLICFLFFKVKLRLALKVKIIYLKQMEKEL